MTADERHWTLVIEVKSTQRVKRLAVRTNLHRISLRLQYERRLLYLPDRRERTCRRAAATVPRCCIVGRHGSQCTLRLTRSAHNALLYVRTSLSLSLYTYYICPFGLPPTMQDVRKGRSPCLVLRMSNMFGEFFCVCRSLPFISRGMSSESLCYPGC